MEESRALSKLSDATDLLMLLEDILNPASIERLSAASWSGLRITLRNARSVLQESQNILSKEFVNRARGSEPKIENLSKESVGAAPNVATGQNATVSPAALNQEFVPNRFASNNLEKNLGDPSKVQITRRDLKATLEKFIETR